MDFQLLINVLFILRQKVQELNILCFMTIGADIYQTTTKQDGNKVSNCGPGCRGGPSRGHRRFIVADHGSDFVGNCGRGRHLKICVARGHVLGSRARLGGRSGGSR